MGKRQWLNLLFSDNQHRTGGSNCEMFEMTWQVLTLGLLFYSNSDCDPEIVTMADSADQLQ